MNFRTPNSLDRFARKLAVREGMDFTPGLTLHCQLFDLGLGSGPSANETNTTASGQGKNFGKGGINTESGAITVGPKGTYQEAGSVGTATGSFNQPTGLAGANVKLARGATLNFTAAPATQPISSLTATPGTVPTSTSPVPPTVPSTTSTTDTSSSTTPASTATGWWTWLTSYWTGLSTWQQVAAGIAGVLVLWLIFHRRKG